MLLQKLIAKKSKDGKVTNLYEHSMAVADKCLELFRNLGINDKKLEQLCYICGLLHDIGKCSKGFQNYIKGDNKEYVYHNIFGYYIIKNKLDAGILEYKNGNIIANVILYHHPVNDKTDNGSPKASIKDEICTKVLQEYVTLIKERFPSIKDMEIKDVEFEDRRKGIYYSSEPNSNYNTYLFIISNIVKFADCIVGDEETYDSIVYRKNTVNPEEIIKPEGYDNRFDVQVGKVDKELSKYNLSVFKSETGFGKTMLGLLYALKSNNRKVYWVCPRNTIAEGVYDRLTDELGKLRLSDKVSVGLLLTNDWKKGNKDPDITVTNMDNFLRPLIKNDALPRAYNSLFSTAIFDEFHEYLDKSSLMAFFMVMLRAREMTGSKTLCLSATPIYSLIPRDSRGHKVEYVDETISKRKYMVEFCDDIKQLETKGKGYLISVNATKTAQAMYSKTVDNVIHSRFLGSDISKRMKMLSDEFGKKNRNTPKRTSWSATNIISTGVDISFNNIIIKSPTPNRFIQAIGRCNRWSDGKAVHKIIFCPWNNSLDDRAEKTSLDVMNLGDISNRLYSMLKERFNETKEVEFGALYKANEEFVESSAYKEQYIRKLWQESYQNLQSYITYNFAKKHDGTKSGILSKAPLRKTDDEAKEFYVKFPGIDELFIGNSIIFNFKQIFKENRKRKENFEEKLRDACSNKEGYFKNKYQAKNMGDIIGYLMNKARDSETPFPMLDIFTYDKNLGVVKLQDNNKF